MSTRKLFAAALLCAAACLTATPARAQSRLADSVERELPALVATYKHLHANPELSHQEKNTAALVARELRALGYEVTENVGKYRRPEWKAYGVVGVMRNGAGPTVLVRADMDALPYDPNAGEQTGLPYASKVVAKDDDGKLVSVMHACGHDAHVASFLGTAKLLAGMKDDWSGTLVLVAQPSEEKTDGALALLDDGLYTRFPKPDVALALHVKADLEAGRVGVVPGPAFANSSTVLIKVRGKGSHGSRPEDSIDPVVIAAEIVLSLQAIVARENKPTEPAVVTVGSIRGGEAPNIIPDEVDLKLTVRSYDRAVQRKLLESIRRRATNIAEAAGVPAELLPVVTVVEPQNEVLYNDPALTERLAEVFRRELGADAVARVEKIMGGEDFSRYAAAEVFARYGLRKEVPITLFYVGTTDADKLAEARKSGKLPTTHQTTYAPLPEPTLRTGVRAMTAAVLELLRR
ncbi:MAG TPA: amidohydrolase [Pyrinomonadaceae bacterium]|nr:amidohydrolase [Pyrinomonadaceae bacterium]